MRLRWALLAGALLGGLAAWWSMRESAPSTPETRHGAATATATAAAAAAAAAASPPSLYRWRDDQGVLHITEQPPKDTHYERIGRDTQPGIQIRGDTETRTPTPR